MGTGQNEKLSQQMPLLLHILVKVLSVFTGFYQVHLGKIRQEILL